MSVSLPLAASVFVALVAPLVVVSRAFASRLATRVEHAPGEFGAELRVRLQAYAAPDD